MYVCVFSNIYRDKSVLNHVVSASRSTFLRPMVRLSQTKSSGKASLHKVEQKKIPHVSSPNHSGIILILLAE